MIKTEKGSVSPMPGELPVLPLMSTVIFPLGISTIQVWYEQNLRLLEARAKKDDVIGFSFARTADMDRLTTQELSVVGTAAKIMKIEGFGEGGKQITVQGLKRIRLKDFAQEKPYLVARVEYLEDIGGDPEDGRREANRIVELVKRLVELDPSYPAELYHICSMNADTPGKLADMIASTFHFDLSGKQSVLEELDVRKRLARLVHLLKLEIGRAELSKNVAFEVRRDLERSIKEQILREEMKTIKEELGNGGLHAKEVAELRNRIRESALPADAERQALLEVERLRLISTASAEYGMVRTHLDWLMSLPWTKASCGDVDIGRFEAMLSQEHFGQEKVKEGILQLFSIRKLRRDLKGIALCFLGPAGTGKTSLAQTIAKALGRRFVRVNLAGVRDEAAIKGRRSTYAEAFPGKLINAIREAEYTNPLIMIEGIGKMGTENLRGDPAAALAEALDPERNSSFVDSYLGVPFDLSDVIFVTAASVPEEIPGSLFDLMEMIEFSGFIEEEKLEIAKKFILPILLKRHGLSERDVQCTDGALRKVIRQYTVEAGIKSLQREMEEICRKCARAKASRSSLPCRITKDNLEEYLGMPIYIPDIVPKHPGIGVAIGLAWTEAGGDLMLIEALKMRGSGQVIFTGQLGEIMKESIQAAHSYVRSKAEMLEINYDDFTNHDIHVHFPSGSIPKDGPSAGITVSLAIASVMSERPIRNDMAMSGEISLRGKVLPVAGVREKVSAAHRVGIRNVMLPKGNEKNLLDLPEKIKRETEFIFVERIEEVFKHALMEPDESQKGIEDILRRELGKMAKMERQKRARRKKPGRKAAKKR